MCISVAGSRRRGAEGSTGRCWAAEAEAWRPDHQGNWEGKEAWWRTRKVVIHSLLIIMWQQ